jgi:arabinogalactan oligomer / maltooligosaccharide transport system substrate-binding protein
MDVRDCKGFLIVALLIAVAVAGCAPGQVRVIATPSATAPVSPLATPDGTPAGPITLTYWEDDTDAAGVLLDELAANFSKANPGITIKRVHYSYDDLRNEFRASSLFTGNPPDIVRAPGEFTGPFGELKIVKPVDELFGRDVLDAFLPGAVAGATEHGVTWGIPDNFGGHLLLLYNKSLVKEVPTDTDSWVQQLKTLTDPANGQYGLVFDTTESYWLIPWLAGFGGWPLDAQEKPALDTAEMVEALWFLHDLKYQDKVVPEKVDYQGTFDLFSQGKAAYAVDGAWNLDKYKGLGVDLGVALLPRVTKTQQLPAPMATGNYWFVQKDVGGDKLAAAEKFIQFMTSAATQQEWLTKMKRLPSNKQTLGSTAIKNDALLPAEVEQLRVARGVPPVLEMTCAWRGMDDYFGKVMNDEVSPDDAPPKMQAEADACAADMAIDTPTPGPGPTPTP